MTFWNSFYPRYENATLDTFIVKSLSAARLLAVVREACEHGFTRNLIVSGQVGTGKTFLARSIVKSLSVFEDSFSPILKKRFRTYTSETVKYCLIGDIIQERRAMISGDATASVEDYVSAPLLIVDEIGVQFKTDSERTLLFPVFDERYNKKEGIRKMKKLVLMFVAVAAISFASCGNKTAQAEAVDSDSVAMDSAAVDTVAADTVAADSAAAE